MNADRYGRRSPGLFLWSAGAGEKPTERSPPRRAFGFAPPAYRRAGSGLASLAGCSALFVIDLPAPMAFGGYGAAKAGFATAENQTQVMAR